MGGAPGLEGEHRPALLCPSGPGSLGSPQSSRKVPSSAGPGAPLSPPPPSSAFPRGERGEERTLVRPGPPPGAAPHYAHGRPWPLKQHFVKTVVAGPARVCRT